MKDKKTGNNEKNNNGNDDDEASDVDRSDDDEEKEENENENEVGENDDNKETALALKNLKKIVVKQKGTWKLTSREFLWEPHTSVTSVAFNKTTSLLVVGFDKGVFGLYEMPGCVSIHRLSVSNHSLNTACINTTGEWLALGSTRLGQLLVWEWQVGFLHSRVCGDTFFLFLFFLLSFYRSCDYNPYHLLLLYILCLIFFCTIVLCSDWP